jgi:hypothetical protein
MSPAASFSRTSRAAARRLPEQRDARRALRPHGHVAEVLLGEQLGRRHHRDLIPGRNRLQRRGERNEGLAAADVAVHETVHRHPRRHVGRYLRDDPKLRTGRLERKRAEELVEALRHRRHRDARLLLACEFPESHADLQSEELLEDQRSMRRRRERRELGGIDVVGRKVHGEQRAVQRLESHPLAHLSRHHGLREMGGSLDRAGDDLAHGRNRHLPGLLVDGNDACRGRDSGFLLVVVVESFDLGVNDLPATALAALDATVDEPERPRLQLLLEVASLVEPEQLDAAGVVGERGRKHRPPAPPPHRDLSRAADAAHERHVTAGTASRTATMTRRSS